MNHLESVLSEQSESRQCCQDDMENCKLPVESLPTGNMEETPMDTTEEGPVETGTHAEEGVDHVKQSAHKQYLEKFLNELAQKPDNESKLQYAIDFMEASIAQSGSPHFKSFWEARNVCLQLFKENISPVLRSILWTKYNELSKEARRLKEILDEQSAFAVEQIEMAITALENDIAGSSEQLHKVVHQELEIKSKALAHRLPFYQQMQKELNLLNAQAARINALRKELIRTEMRVRQKNKFFQKLSLAGDSVFPKRKELIKQVSDQFIADVDGFIQNHFNDSNHEKLFILREEIKALQSMAKMLTLNTHSFTHTRMRLSECWDKIKGEEKERKKERAHQKVLFKENFDQAMQELQSFKNDFPTLSITEASKRLDEMGHRFRNLELSREERQVLKNAYQEARQPILDKANADQAARQLQEQEKEDKRKNSILEIKRQIESLYTNSKSLSVDELTQQRDAILETLNTTSTNKVEKLEIERQLKPLRDLILEKKESELLALSDDDRQSILQLKEVLKQRRERRQVIKDQLDALRKTSGNSGLDFEQAMNYNEQLAAEKERLEKINQGILEIEQKISQLQKKK